uniref:Uncharacterized protein n=1 Tax=Arundo donax TaxID=35708 RepID=A0A0A9BXS2_ARUDO
MKNQGSDGLFLKCTTHILNRRFKGSVITGVSIAKPYHMKKKLYGGYSH